MLLLILACSRAAPPGPPAEKAPSEPANAPAVPGHAPGHHEEEPVITSTGAGPYQVGMTGAAALALPGAKRAEPTCSCAYDVQFPLQGATLGVTGADQVCQVWISGPALRSAAGLAVGDPLAHFAQAYGETRTEEATGLTLFANAPWLAAQAGESGLVTGIRLGGCPE